MRLHRALNPLQTQTTRNQTLLPVSYPRNNTRVLPATCPTRHTPRTHIHHPTARECLTANYPLPPLSYEVEEWATLEDTIVLDQDPTRPGENTAIILTAELRAPGVASSPGEVLVGPADLPPHHDTTTTRLPLHLTCTEVTAPAVQLVEVEGLIQTPHHQDDIDGRAGHDHAPFLPFEGSGHEDREVSLLQDVQLGTLKISLFHRQGLDAYKEEIHRDPPCTQLRGERIMVVSSHLRVVEVRLEIVAPLGALSLSPLQSQKVRKKWSY